MRKYKLGLIGLSLVGINSALSGCTKVAHIEGYSNKNVAVDSDDIKQHEQHRFELNSDMYNAVLQIQDIELAKKFPEMYPDSKLNHKSTKVSLHNLKLLIQHKAEGIVDSYYDQADNDYENNISDGSIDAYITINNYIIEINELNHEINVLRDWQATASPALKEKYNHQWNQLIHRLQAQILSDQAHQKIVQKLVNKHPNDLKLPSNHEIAHHNYHNTDANNDDNVGAAYLWYLYLMQDQDRYLGSSSALDDDDDSDSDENPSSSNNRDITDGDTEANPDADDDNDEDDNDDDNEDDDDDGGGDDDGGTSDDGGDAGGDAGGGDAGGESYHVNHVKPHMVILIDHDHHDAHWV